MVEPPLPEMRPSSGRNAPTFSPSAPADDYEFAEFLTSDEWVSRRPARIDRRAAGGPEQPPGV